MKATRWGRYSRVVAIEHEAPTELDTAVARARARAAATGDLRPIITGTFEGSVSEELADFAQRILTDGTYAREVRRLGQEDPDLATI